MKLPALVAAVVFSSFTPAFALTDADITDTALAGKTLIFTIVNGTSPFATTGTWSGTFSAAGTSFAVANITGNTKNITTACSLSSSGGVTVGALDKFLADKGAAELDIYLQDGVGHYEVFVKDMFGSSVNGTFTIGAPPKTSEIGIQQPVGTDLKDGVSTKGFGTVKKGKTKSRVFTVKNSGKGKLTGLGFSVTGANKASFIVSKPEKTTLAAGASTTFTVKFTPKSQGEKNATLKVISNDADESPFDIKLAGKGTK